MNGLSDYIKMIPKALSIITPLTPAVISNFFPYETELRTVLQPPVNINETTFYTTVYFILCTFVLLYCQAPIFSTTWKWTKSGILGCILIGRQTL